MDNLISVPSDNEKLLYKLVIQFLIFSQGSHKLLEPHLVQIGKRLRNGANINELTPELQSISKTLLHISKQAKQEVQIDENTATSELKDNYLLKRLDELLEESGVPLAFQHQTAVLKQLTRGEINNGLYKKVIDSAIGLLLDIRGFAENEQQGIDNFLLGLSKELNEIEKQVETAGEANRLSISNRDNLNSAVHHQVDVIRDAALSSQELASLKIYTNEQLDRLVLQLIEHKQLEDERQERAQQQINFMSQKLLDLETETETLRTKLKIEHDKAMCDPLTGLPNRLAYNTRVELEVNRWKRYHAPLSLAIWDIDHFKRINDTYGHKAGDKTLALVGQLLIKNCRNTDFVARYGGEEFVMLLPNTNASRALEMAEKIRKIIQNSGFNFNGEDINLTLCCGISDFATGDQHEDVFIRADQALYQCKHRGRNRSAVYTD